MRKMFIDGSFVESLSGETFAVENPATEEMIDDVPRARAEDADRAVLAALQAQDDWRFVPGIEKCELLHGAARNMREHRERIATLLTQKGSKPLIANIDRAEPRVGHRHTHVSAFPGNVTNGKRIAKLAAERVKKVNLELGGNDPFIVCDDVDLEVAVRGAVWAAYLNMGQVCTSGERFYVFDSVASKFIDKFVEFTGSLRLGNPMGPDVDLGPMINAQQREKVEQKLDPVREMGADMLCR